MTHEHAQAYAGPATVLAGEQAVELRADLRAAFQPIDGRYHWYGRLESTPALAPGGTVTIRTRHGSAEGRLSDADTWGRLRIAGVGRPPF